MRVSIVLPAFNEEKLLPASLEAVALALPGFTEQGWETEVVVCDNNSTDRTAEIARQHGAKVVFEPVNQISRARNCGAASASGDWLVFVDADSLPTQELFRDVARQIRSGSIIGGGSTVRLEVDRRGPRFWVGCWNRLSRTFRLAAGSFVFCDAAAFRAIGGFSLDLYASEELDFSRRLRRYGRRDGRRFVILVDHPLLTSARKLQLYTSREVFRFLLRAFTRPRKTLRSREACEFWYDGRR